MIFYEVEEVVELYIPKIEDLWFKEKMLSDEATMSYNHAWGGTIPFPKERWEKWYNRWVLNHENKRFYRYVKENETFLGEVAYHFEDERQIYIADVIIYARIEEKDMECKHYYNFVRLPKVTECVNCMTILLLIIHLLNYSLNVDLSKNYAQTSMFW